MPTRQNKKLKHIIHLETRQKNTFCTRLKFKLNRRFQANCQVHQEATPSALHNRLLVILAGTERSVLGTALRSQCEFTEGHSEHNILQRLRLSQLKIAGGRRTGWWYASNKKICVLHFPLKQEDFPSGEFPARVSDPETAPCLHGGWLKQATSKPRHFLAQHATAKEILGQNWLF